MEELKAELGEAVIKLCVDPSYYASVGGGKRCTHHQLGHTGNGVIYCGEPHSTNEHLYAWIGNRLSRVEELHNVEFEVIERLVGDEKARRSRRKT